MNEHNPQEYTGYQGAVAYIFDMVDLDSRPIPWWRRLWWKVSAPFMEWPVLSWPYMAWVRRKLPDRPAFTSWDLDGEHEWAVMAVNRYGKSAVVRTCTNGPALPKVARPRRPVIYYEVYWRYVSNSRDRGRRPRMTHWQRHGAQVRPEDLEVG